MKKSPAAKVNLSASATLLASGMVAVMSAPANALEWSGYAGASTEYTDNSLQDPVDKQWDLSYIGLGGVNLTHRTGNIDLSALYDLTYTTFENKTQSNETALIGNGEAHWFLIPDTLTWDFNHSNNRTTRQTGVVDTTDTRSTQTIISTGPSSRLNLTARDSLQLSAQAMEVSTSGDVDNESSRNSFSAALVHLTSQIQSFGIRATQQQVEYDGDVSPDVTFTQVAMEWNRAYRAGRMQVSAGQNRSKRDELSATDGDLYRAYFDFTNVGHTFSLAAAQELTDSMLGLYQPGFAEPSQQSQGVQQDNFTPGSTALDVIDVVNTRHVEANYSTVRLCDRCQPSLRVSYDYQNYELQLLDQETVTAQAGLVYSLTQRWNANVTVSRADVDFLDTQRSDTTTSTLLGLTYDVTPDLVLQGQLQRDRRDSDGDLQDYSVATALVGFRYLFGNQGQ